MFSSAHCYAESITSSNVSVFVCPHPTEIQQAKARVSQTVLMGLR